MCGYSITFQRPENDLSHRGTKHSTTQFGGYHVEFHSLPLSSAGTGIEQPLEFPDHLLVFNGEIFNYKELDQRSKSDLHYLQNLFKKLKYDIYKFYNESTKWDGFWSIAIINKNGSMFIMTDPLGKKQCYSSRKGISSEIRSISTPNDYIYVWGDKNFGTSNTCFHGVERLIPGSLYKYDSKYGSAERIESLKYFKDKPTKSLYDTIDEAVRTRSFNQIGRVSLLLSGGLDSSIILHHLLKQGTYPEIISLDNIEREAVEKVCSFYGVTPNFIKIPDQPDFVDIFNCYEQDLDYGSLIPNYYLFKACSNNLVMTGDGADEVFGGYKRNLEQDTFNYDLWKELPYYHNIRIDRTSMRWTKEARSPLMSKGAVEWGMSLHWPSRRNKSYLRETYQCLIPGFILNGIKRPLRDVASKEEHIIMGRHHFLNTFK